MNPNVIRIKYSPLFRVAFREWGVTDSFLEGVYLQPFKGSVGKLKNYGLITKTRPYGVEVYFKSYPDLSPLEQVQSKIEKRERFRFLFSRKKLPFGYAIADSASDEGITVRHFRLNNLSDSNIQLSDERITNGNFLSASDATKIVISGEVPPEDDIATTYNHELFKLKPLGIIDIYWEDEQKSTDFKEYWIDLQKV